MTGYVTLLESAWEVSMLPSNGESRLFKVIIWPHSEKQIAELSSGAPLWWRVYPSLAFLPPFSVSSSALVQLKTEERNKLDTEHDLRVSVSPITPHSGTLVKSINLRSMMPGLLLMLQWVFHKNFRAQCFSVFTYWGNEKLIFFFCLKLNYWFFLIPLCLHFYLNNFCNFFITH